MVSGFDVLNLNPLVFRLGFLIFLENWRAQVTMDFNPKKMTFFCG